MQIKPIAIAVLLVFFAAGNVAAGAREDFNAGRRAAKNGDYPKAYSLLTKVINAPGLKKRQMAAAYCVRGKVLTDMGKYDAAIKDFDKALELYQPQPGESNFHFLTYNSRGIAFAKKGMHDRAREDFKKSLEIKPDHEPARRNLGIQ